MKFPCKREKQKSLIGKSAISDLGTSELVAVEIKALQTNQNVLRLQAKSLKLNVHCT
jgi:hypothetical protein